MNKSFVAGQADAPMFVMPPALARTIGANPRLAELIGAWLDSTERRVAEVERARLAAILEETTDLIATASPDQRVVYLNRAGRRMLGYHAEEPMIELVETLCSAATHARWVTEVLPTVMEKGTWTGELVFCARNGDSIPFSAIVTAHLSVNGELEYLSCVARDLRAEMQLRHAQKLEAVGRLAGGIAHDFNNILSTVKLNVENLAQIVEGNPDAQHDLREIERATDRAAAVTRQLLAYSRRQILQPVAANLNEIVQGFSTLLQRMITESVTVDLVLDPTEPWVRVDPSQMEQVLMNLVVNARDAMPDGGRLTISTRVLDGNRAPVGLQDVRDGAVLMTIRDTGLGMSEEVKGRAFEPFFTTKSGGERGGLGLATVYGIVTQLGGMVTLDSAPDTGTAVHIYLPRHPDVRPPQSLPVADEDDGPKTVLLVEDEEGVRVAARRLLERQGYRVLEASDGIEALRIVDTTGARLHLIITDVVMPGLDGPSLVKRLRERHTDCEALFMSGYSGETIEGVLAPDARFLSKPFNAAELLTLVRELLDHNVAA